MREGVTAVEDESLNELGVGEADGLTWEEIEARFSLPNWDVDPDQVNVPGGESLIGFYERCVGAIERLVQRHPRELVVLVVHGGFIEQAMKLYQGLGGATRLRPRIEHCSMTEVEFSGERKRLLRYNDLSPIGRDVALQVLGHVKGQVEALGGVEARVADRGVVELEVALVEA